MRAIVLHIEVGDFFTAAVERCYPYLRGRAFVVAPSHPTRARVYAASPPARAAGIRQGMLVKDAQDYERRLIIHPVDEELYAAIYREMVKILSFFSPVIEPWRYGRVYLEIMRQQKWAQAQDAAYRIQKEMERRLGLKPAVGLGSNKLISRAASTRAVKRAEILWVPPGHEQPFIAPFRVQFLPHVTQKMTSLLNNLNVWQARDLLGFTRRHLQTLFGDVGWRIYDEARGIDSTPVMPPEKQSALYEGWLFVPETNDVEVITDTVRVLAGRLARRLREMSMLAGRLKLSVWFADGRRISGQNACQPPARYEAELWRAAEPLVDRLLTRRVAVYRLALRAFQCRPAGQQDLFAPETPEKWSRLAEAMDKIKARYGENAIQTVKQSRLGGTRCLNVLR